MLRISSDTAEKNYMTDKIFIDTNILVYAYTTGDVKKHEAIKKN